MEMKGFVLNGSLALALGLFELRQMRVRVFVQLALIGATELKEP